METYESLDAFKNDIQEHPTYRFMVDFEGYVFIKDHTKRMPKLPPEVAALFNYEKYADCNPEDGFDIKVDGTLVRIFCQEQLREILESNPDF